MIPIYFNFFSVGWLIAVAFTLVGAIFCFTIQNKSRAAFHFGMMFVMTGVFSLAYFVAASIYHPYAVAHRYFTIAFTMGTMIHTFQFFLCFPEDDYRKIRRIFLIVMWIGVFIITSFFIVKSLSARYIFQFHSHQWDVMLDELSKIIGYFILLYVIIVVCAGIWRIFTLKGKIRWVVLFLLVDIAIISIVPAIANILSRDGAIGRETYLNLFVTLTLIGLFIALILFINNTRDRTSFMTKIIGICLVFFMVILLGVSYYASDVNERSYDIIQQSEIEILQAGDEGLPKGAKFIARFKIADNALDIVKGEGESIPDFSDHQYAFLNSVYFDKIRRMDMSNYAIEMPNLLMEAHPYFEGYKQDLIYYMREIPAGSKDPVGDILNHVADVNKTVFFYSNKIRAFPADSFRKKLKEFLAGTKESFGYFRRVMEARMDEVPGDGEDLRSEMMRYLAPFQAPETRHYHSGRDGTAHYICYMYYDANAGIVYDVGFSYVDYRKYIHPDSLILVVLLVAVVLIIGVAFRLFFLGTLIHPLNNVLEGLREVQKGNLEINIPIVVEDEIGFMSQNFNEMVWAMSADRKKLDDYANHLEEMVEQRTRELQNANNELAAAMGVMEAMNDELITTNKDLNEAQRIAALDMAMAQNVQSSFFPKEAPNSDEWEISFVFKPMSGISGDMYDFYEESGVLKGLSLFDVSGHGIASGLITMIAKSVVNRKILEMGNSKLHEIIESVNEELIQELGKVDNYLTGILLRFSGSKVELVNAGHTDPLYISGRERKVKVVDIKDRSIKGMFLGIEIMKGVFTSISFPMQKGDMLLLYTDCLLESKNDANDEFGLKRVVHSLKEAGEGDTRTVLSRITRDLVRFTGSENLADDLTLILIKRKA